MRIAEDNSLSSEDSTLAHQTIARTARADTQSKAYGRDVFKRIRTADVCRLSRHLATLLRAGMPLVPALTALVEQLQEGQAKDNPLADIMERVADDVNSGKTLSDAIGKHPDIFSGLFVSMVAAGEASGTLEEILVRLAEILEKRVHLAAKVKAAVAYPLMMIVVAVAVVVFLMSVVVPGITTIFLEMNRPLPWPTKWLISTSAFMRTYWAVLVVLVFAFFFGVGAAYRTRKGRYWMDRSKLRLPLFGRLFLKLEVARLSRTLGILLASGIPVLNALDIARQVVQNSFIAGALGSVKDLVCKGDAVANAVKKTGLFPPIVYHIISTSQVSGNLEEGLIDIADMYDGEVELATKTLTSLLEPVILLCMGAVVGFIVLAVLLPIFDINQML
jgi:general secretion pathway protein F